MRPHVSTHTVAHAYTVIHHCHDRGHEPPCAHRGGPGLTVSPGVSAKPVVSRIRDMCGWGIRCICFTLPSSCMLLVRRRTPCSLGELRDTLLYTYTWRNGAAGYRPGCMPCSIWPILAVAVPPPCVRPLVGRPASCLLPHTLMGGSSAPRGAYAGAYPWSTRCLSLEHATVATLPSKLAEAMGSGLGQVLWGSRSGLCSLQRPGGL
jgi:hypothetical protein